MSNRERVVEAVNILIVSTNYAQLLKELSGIIEHWDTHPMTYGGQLSPLNALIDVGIANKDAYDKLIRLVEKKRKLLPDIRRVDYQRNFMIEKRERIAKAVELFELQKGKLPNAEAKRIYGQETQARWMKARDEFVAAKGQLTWAERNAARGEFWEGIDKTLDANLAAARAKKSR